MRYFLGRGRRARAGHALLALFDDQRLDIHQPRWERTAILLFPLFEEALPRERGSTAFSFPPIN